MIQHVTHVYSDSATLLADMSTGPVANARASCGEGALLVQIYSAETQPEHMHAIAAAVSKHLPRAVIVGATTVGEVAHGRLITGQTVIGFTFFQASQLHTIAVACTGGDEREKGAEIGRRVAQSRGPVAGVLLLSTPLSIDASELLEGLSSSLQGIPVFGGGAGDYAAMNQSWVFCGTQSMERGAVAVVFSGTDLHIEPQTYLGWRPLSRPMRISKVDGLRVQEIDGRPAFDVYRRYLNIANDSQFFLNALEFPLLMERDGQLLARVPVAADETGALQFVADVHEGEIFRIGYGDLDLIVDDARGIQLSMRRFAPQALFLYTCGCRRFLMQEDVELETQPFQALAPTFGFYTYGEFFGTSRLSLLNSTMVAVGLREGDPPTGVAGAREAPYNAAAEAFAPPSRDPYANKHTRVVSRLLRFIDTLTSELEASHREVTQLSITDRLTQLVNRIRLDQVLEEWIQLAQRYGTPFSAILLDLDHFKEVNDHHGHLVGDDVLKRVAHALTVNTRSVDVVGRWGGEEFLVVVPNTRLEEARRLAEKLRAAIGSTEIPIVGRKRCSLGVAEYTPGDDPHTLVARADKALYDAKRAGRNRVEIGRG